MVSAHRGATRVAVISFVSVVTKISTERRNPLSRHAGSNSWRGRHPIPESCEHTHPPEAGSASSGPIALRIRPPLVGRARARAGGPSIRTGLATRKPLPCLVFVLPLLLAYEIGVTGWAGRRRTPCGPGPTPGCARAGGARADRPGSSRSCLVVAICSAGRPSTAATGGSPRGPPRDGGREPVAGGRPGRPEQAGRPRLRLPGTARASWRRGRPAGAPDRASDRVPRARGSTRRPCSAWP